MKKQAADLGIKNIPKVFMSQEAPAPLHVLWYREESSNPENVTVEIWSTEDRRFYIFEGYNGDNEWGQDDVSFVSEHDTIQKALSTVKANYAIIQDEEPHEQVATTKKRLMRRSAKRTRV